MREPYEAERCNIGKSSFHGRDRGPPGRSAEGYARGGTLPQWCSQRSGINALSTRYGYTNLINLKGGILGYGSGGG